MIQHLPTKYFASEKLIAAVCVKVRFQLEQSREGLQRQLAATDGQMHVLQARLEDSQAEEQVRPKSHPLNLLFPTLSLGPKNLHVQ